MKINHSLDLELTHPGLPLRLQATQDDSVSHMITLHLKEQGRPWPIPADAAVLVHFRKSDRTGGVYDTLPDGSAAWQFRGNELRITLAPQVLTAPGDTALAVTLIRGSSRLTVATVLLQVVPCPGFAGLSESYSYVSAFLPQPITAAPGQLLQVKEVDALGVVLSTEAVSGGIGGSAGNILLSLLQKAVYTEDVSADLAALEQQFGDEVPAVTLVSIDAVYTGGAVYVGTDVKLLQGVTVTACYSDGTRQQVKNFSLSGVIQQGDNTITVSYGGCIDTVIVVGMALPTGMYSIYNNLSYATNSNTAATASPGSSYSCVIRAQSGYELKRVMITMNGVTVFEENYTTAPLESSWSTDNVTGDIVITAIAQVQLAISSLAVSYTGGEVAAGTKLSDLTGITVTVIYTDGTQQQLTGGYGLTGTIGAGSNTITVSYSGHTATFIVVGVAAGPVLLHSWDFTKSLTDTVAGVTAVTNATQDANGITFAEPNKYMRLLNGTFLNRAIEIDIASGNLATPTSQHARVFGLSAGHDDCLAWDGSCFTWRYNNDIGWASFAGTASTAGWDATLDGTSYPISFFHNKTLRLECDGAGYISVYFAELGSTNFTKITTFAKAWAIKTGNFIMGGSDDTELYPITFSAVRIYNKEA